MTLDVFTIAVCVGLAAVLLASAFLIVAWGISIIRGDDDEEIHRR